MRRIWELNEGKTYKAVINGKQQEPTIKLVNKKVYCYIMNEWKEDKVKFNDIVDLYFQEVDLEENNYRWYRYIFATESKRGDFIIHVCVTQKRFEEIKPKDAVLISTYEADLKEKTNDITIIYNKLIGK